MVKFTEICEIFEKFGVDLVGAIPFELVERHLLNTRSRVRIPQNAKSVIIAVFCYNAGQKPVNIAKYAAVRDYHAVVNSILADVGAEILKVNPQVNFAHFADASPLPEVHAAQLAGLGVRGKNNLLITEKYGSYINVGSIVLDDELDEYTTTELKFCENCGICIKACPTDALSQTGFNRKLCISDITYKKQLGAADAAVLKSQKSVLGCDLCQICCPHNEGVNLTKIKEFYEDVRESYSPDECQAGRLYGHIYCNEQIKRNFEVLSED